MHTRTSILLPLAGTAAGLSLLAASLGSIPLNIGTIPTLVAIGAAAATAVMLPRLIRVNSEYRVYEVRINEAPRKTLEVRLKLLSEFIRSIGYSNGFATLASTCSKRGCTLYLILPKDDNLEKLIKGLFPELELRIHNGRLEDILRKGGEGPSIEIPLAAEIESDQAITEGEILIGRRVRDNKPLYASLDEFWRHTGIFGTTGSGKTTTTSFIVSQLGRHVNVIVFDWHGEYPSNLNKLNADYVEVDPPPLPLIPDDLDIEITVNVLEDAFDLTRHQSMLLYQALRSMKRRDVIPEELEDFTDALLATVEVQQAVPSRAELEIRAALERRLRSLITGEGKKYFRVKGRLIQLKDRGITVIRTDKILLMPLRRIYVKMFLAFLYYTALSKGEILNTVVVLEEAHNIASSDTRTIPSILAEARKRKLGLIIVTQSPSSLHPSVLKNTNIRIVHTLKSAQDIAVVAKSMSIPPELRTKLPRLPVGYAIVDTPQLETPQLLYVPIAEFINKP